MHLSSIHIRNFRSLYDIRLSLKPLTVIIGPNASGKSNLFKALQFLYEAVAGDRRDWQAYDSQMDDLLWYGYDELGNRPERLEFSLSFLQSHEIPKGMATYIASLHCGDYIEVDDERLSLRLSQNGQNLLPFFERQGETVTQYLDERDTPLESPRQSKVRSVRTLTLREEGPSFRFPLAQAVYRHITGWRFVDIDVQQARQRSFIPAVPEEVPPLEGDARNLSAVLYALLQRQYEDFEAINQALANFIDLPDSIFAEHDGQNAYYYFTELPFGESRPVSSRNISDGTVRLLSLLALLLGDRSVSLACLEEPDHGLHPRLMLYLADILRRAVAGDEPDRNGNVQISPQVIITTHSPDLMDCFDLDAESDYLQVYVAERDEEGKTIFTPTTAQEFAPWLERYRLGEAVRRQFV